MNIIINRRVMASPERLYMYRGNTFKHDNSFSWRLDKFFALNIMQDVDVALFYAPVLEPYILW